MSNKYTMVTSTASDNGCIVYIYQLKDPIHAAVMRFWYKHDAEEVVLVECTSPGKYRVKIPSVSQLKLNDPIDEALDQLITAPLPEKEKILVDLKRNEIIYRASSGTGLYSSLWAASPKDIARTGRLTLAGNSLGTFYVMFTSNDNLIHALYIQSRTLLFGRGGKQTMFGRGLVADLIANFDGLDVKPPVCHELYDHMGKDFIIDAMAAQGIKMNHSCYKTITDMSYEQIDSKGLRPGPEEDDAKINEEELKKCKAVCNYIDIAALGNWKDFPVGLLTASWQMGFPLFSIEINKIVAISEDRLVIFLHGNVDSIVQDVLDVVTEMTGDRELVVVGSDGEILLLDPWEVYAESDDDIDIYEEDVLDDDSPFGGNGPAADFERELASLVRSSRFDRGNILNN